MFLRQVGQALLLKGLGRILLHVKNNTGTAAKRLGVSGEAHGERATGRGLPNVHVIVVVLLLVSASPFSAEGEGEKIAGSDAQLWPTSCTYASADYVSLFSACALVLVRLLLTLRCCPRVLVLPRCVLYVRLVCCCGCVHLHEVEACGNNKLCCLAVLFCTEWSHGSVVGKTTTQQYVMYSIILSYYRYMLSGVRYSTLHTARDPAYDTV